MSSINTNAAAMTALQTLRSTNNALDTTQGRISTGFRVAEASDNAAYWSIATTMRSDNNSMSTVRDALGLGAAQVDIAYTAMDAVKDTLDQMKTKIVAASQPDVDKAKIQEEIKQLQNDLTTYAQSATFSGGNWLDVDSTAVQKVVASFIRSDAGISLGTIDVDTSKTALFNGDAAAPGMLQSGMTVAKDVSGVTRPTGTAGDGTAAAVSTITGLTAADWVEGDTLTFQVGVNGGEAKSVTVVVGADGLDDATFTAALSAAGVTGVTAAYATDTLTLTGGTGDGDTVDLPGVITGTTIDEDVTVTNFDISNASGDVLAQNLQELDNMLSAVTTAASDLGAIKTRISSQQEFVGKIMDAVDRGVGQLVDADMSEESTRLQALQVQQQLGIQALSIANGNAQSILSLFR